jgi:hypothetical protein
VISGETPIVRPRTARDPFVRRERTKGPIPSTATISDRFDHATVPRTGHELAKLAGRGSCPLGGTKQTSSKQVGQQCALQMPVQVRPSGSPFDRCPPHGECDHSSGPCEGGPLEMFGYAGRSRCRFPPSQQRELPPAIYIARAGHGLGTKPSAAGFDSLAVCKPA